MQRFLFDRLNQPLKSLPKDSHNKLVMLRASIIEALQCLFTQRSFFEGLYDGVEQPLGFDSVLNFGLKDLMSYGSTIDDICRFKAQIRKMILKYEPRLVNPNIIVVQSHETLESAKIQITGLIKADQLEDDFLWKPVLDSSERGF